MTISTTNNIKDLNDFFRDTLLPQLGKVVFSHCVRAMPEEQRQNLIGKVIEFKDFTEDNDPHGEHNFGKVVLDETPYFWKIDYYDKSMKWGSEDPADPKQTVRVLTIMEASEY